MRYTYLCCALFLATLTGCANLPYHTCLEHYETPEYESCQAEIREYRESIDANNYRLCVQAYRQARTHMVVNSHHDQRKGPTPEQVKEALVTNQCRSALKGYWEDYGDWGRTATRDEFEQWQTERAVAGGPGSSP